MGNEIVAIGVRHKVVLDSYARAIRKYLPDRPPVYRHRLRHNICQETRPAADARESGNGILLCTQQSLPSSVNFEFVNKIIIPSFTITIPA